MEQCTAFGDKQLIECIGQQLAGVHLLPMIPMHPVFCQVALVWAHGPITWTARARSGDLSMVHKLAPGGAPMGKGLLRV